MPFTKKQREFLDNANHRWNIKEGATRSGKTYLDYYVIPMRIRRVAGLPGLVVILGNTKGTLQRNIIEPLQDMYGTELVSSIRSDNTAMLFGERCYREPSISEAVLAFSGDVLATEPRGLDETYRMILGYFRELSGMMQAAEAIVPANVQNKLQEYEYGWNKEANFKLAAALGERAQGGRMAYEDD